jgi:DNA-binding CsgD family transcriptional regulator
MGKGWDQSRRLLTTRELQVLTYLRAGYRPKEVAAELGIAYATVRVYRHRARKKVRPARIRRVVATAGLSLWR